MKAPIVGYLPDLDPVTPGIVMDCEAMLPSRRGMKAAPSAISAGIDALAAACYGAAVCTKLDNSYRVFAGTLTKLYEVATSSWSDVTRAAGGDYTMGTSNRWRFAQFGDVTIATNGTDVLQASSSGAFANLTAPKAHCIDTVAGFVMLGGTNEGTYGDQTDRWWCSAYYDHTDWVPDTATQCTTGRLVDTPGPITAVRKLGSNVVYYKGRSMYFGMYRGSPDVWQFQLIPGEIGAASQESVVNIGSEHIFVGYEDIYRFDGSRPVPIGEGIKETFFNDLNKKYRQNVIGMHDFTNSLVYFYYPSASSAAGDIDSCIVYNYRTGKWGRDDRAIEAAMEYLSGQITYANIHAYFPTYADINVSYDSPFWTNTEPLPAIIDTAHTVKVLSGAAGTSTLTTGHIGDDSNYFLLKRVRPRFTIAPTTGSMVNYYKEECTDSFTTDATTTLANGCFDVLRDSAWHRFKFTYTGNVEIPEHDYTIEKTGEK